MLNLGSYEVAVRLVEDSTRQAHVVIPIRAADRRFGTVMASCPQADEELFSHSKQAAGHRCGARFLAVA